MYATKQFLCWGGYELPPVERVGSLFGDIVEEDCKQKHNGGTKQTGHKNIDIAETFDALTSNDSN